MKYLASDEIMLHPKSPGHECLLQNGALETAFSDGEVNVTVSLVNFDVDVAFSIVLLDNPVGSVCMGELQRFGVDISHILTWQGCMSICFLELGADRRPLKVVYDRVGSAIAQMAPSGIDWNQAFVGIRRFHIIGTTPTLSEDAMELSLCVVREAKARSATVSYDLNYQKNLWKYDREAPQVMRELTKSVDVATANEKDVQKSLGVSAAVGVTAGRLGRKKYRALGDQVLREFPSLYLIAITLQESMNADIDSWSACPSDGSRFHTPRRYEIRDIVGRADGGDSFAVGLVYGLTHYQNHQEAPELAVVTSCLRHSILENLNRVSVADVEKLMTGDGSGQV